MNRNSLALVFVVVAALLLAGSNRLATAQSSTFPEHLTIAQALINHLDLSQTTYEHGTPKVRFTAPVESHADCSGFIDALLEQAYGLDQKHFRAWFGSGRPTAKRYHDAIEEQNGFRRIEHVQEMRPGDLLAVKYFNNKSNTGHVMLVADRPRRMAAKEPSIAGTIQWEVTIIDSSESGHGPTDTRHKKGADGKDHDGLGEGVLRIYSDTAGNVAGFAWSTQKGSKFKEPSDEHLVIGRLNRE